MSNWISTDRIYKHTTNGLGIGGLGKKFKTFNIDKIQDVCCRHDIIEMNPDYKNFVVIYDSYEVTEHIIIEGDIKEFCKLLNTGGNF
tara:strand:+ start:700 stop:960 length:261 start_codon:yes stop_codon:yes gene_type:complete